MQEMCVLVDNCLGSNIPINFVNRYDMKRWHCTKLAKELKRCWGVKGGIADEVWQDILDKAWYKSDDGKVWRLDYNEGWGDLVAVTGELDEEDSEDV